MAVMVKRDGSVVVDGAIVGRVVKEMRQGLFMTMLGAGYSSEGTPFWVPFDAEGNKLADGYDTRKRAVSMVEAAARPLTVEKVEIQRGWSSDAPFVSAWVSQRGYSFGVSRYAGEEAWVVDAMFTPGCSMPAWSNGGGSRYTLAKVLKGEAADAATSAAIAAGAWPILEG